MSVSARTKNIVIIAMLCALSYVVLLVSRLLPNVVLFLRYDPKDVIIVIGGFIMGPIAAFCISVIVSFFEFITVSTTGPIGMIMNVISTCAFACTASFIYKRFHNVKGAFLGMAVGVLIMTGMMILWNYIVTPLYMNVPREVVTGMLIPTFLPFNLLKGSLNAAITILIYKPIVSALRKTRLLQPVSGTFSSGKGKVNAGTMLVGALLLITSVLLFLVLAGVL